MADAKAPGDAAAPSKPADPAAPNGSAANEAPAPVPDGFAEFIESGDAGGSGGAPGGGNLTSQQNPAGGVSTAAPQVAPPSDSGVNPGSFITGLFRRASTTIESAVEHAKREVARNEVLAHAQTSLSEIGHSFQPTLSGMSEFGGMRRRSSEAELASDAPLPEKTIPLKALHLNSVSGSTPLFTFINTVSKDIVVVTDSTIEAFQWNGHKLLEAQMDVTWGGDAVPTAPAVGAGSASNSGSVMDVVPPPRRRSPVPGKLIKATCAVYVPATEEVVVGHEDGALRIYSVRAGQMGMQIRAGAAEDSVPTCMRLLPSKPSRLVVGCDDGTLRLVELAELTNAGVLEAPEMCSATLGSGMRDSPVSCVDAVMASDGTAGAISPVNVFAGYADGALMLSGLGGGGRGVSFIAHGAQVSGAAALYGGALIVSIGNESDPSLVACEPSTGRCLVRRMLKYTPTCISSVPRRRAREAVGAFCPSENALLVGGSEGQVESYRVVVLSPDNVELRLMRRISERHRGRNREIVQTQYSGSTAVLLAVTGGGELRRWHLCAADAASLTTLPNASAPRYTESNVSDALAPGAPRDDTRLSSVDGVMAAQKILASVLEGNVMGEDGKDRLVEEFQRRQAEMQDKASAADAELRRARRRIGGRFAHGLTAGDGRLARAARRTAAYELDFVDARHGESLTRVQRDAVARLRGVLVDALRGAGQAGASLRAAAEALGTESARD